MANISLNLSQSIETVSDLISFYSLHGSMNDLTQFFERLELVTNLFILICIKNTSITRYITHHTKRLRNKRNSLNNTVSPNEFEYLRKILGIVTDEQEIKIIKYYLLCLYNLYLINDFILLDTLDHPGYKRELLKSESSFHLRNTVMTAFKTPIKKITDAYIEFGFLYLPTILENLKKLQDEIQINLKEKGHMQTMKSKLNSFTHSHVLKFENNEPRGAEQVVNQGTSSLVTRERAENVVNYNNLNNLNLKLNELVDICSKAGLQGYMLSSIERPNRTNVVSIRSLPKCGYEKMKTYIETDYDASMKISSIDEYLSNTLQTLSIEINKLTPEQKVILKALSNKFIIMSIKAIQNTAELHREVVKYLTRYTRDIANHELLNLSFETNLYDYDDIEFNSNHGDEATIEKVYWGSNQKPSKFISDVNTKTATFVSIQRQFVMALLMLYLINPFILLDSLKTESYRRKYLTFGLKRTPPQKLMQKV